jgi:cell division protein FtsW (lipid II flippase)
MMDNDDLIAAFFVLTVTVLLYVCQPDLSQVLWIG